MVKPKVFVTRAIPQAGLVRLQDVCELTVWPDELPPPYETLRAQAAQADGLLCLLTDRIDAALIADCTRLKVISQMAVGYDNIDIAAATARGLPVGNTPGVLTETTADLAFTLLLAAARRISEGERYVRAGKWQTWIPTLLMGQDIHGATLAIIGMGRIGMAVAQRASGFNMRVIYVNPRPVEAAAARGWQRRTLEQALAEADFVSLHTPLNAATRYLINAAALARMKPTCVLVNTARGAVVDPAALYEALKDGRIAAAALDVTEPEPLPAAHPLLTLDNCLIVPHIASSSVATRNRMATMAADNLAAGLRGERLPYCANPAVYSA
ncbi:MAG: D-glycerate dehydrogenase [Chloroflexi bacterium]|nr:D-glycerate dehydrogenase [Chloroflexota bacterium]